MILSEKNVHLFLNRLELATALFEKAYEIVHEV